MGNEKNNATVDSCNKAVHRGIFQKFIRISLVLPISNSLGKFVVSQEV